MPWKIVARRQRLPRRCTESQWWPAVCEDGLWTEQAIAGISGAARVSALIQKAVDVRGPSASRSRRKDRSSFSRHLVIDARCHCGRIHPHRRVGEDPGDSVERIGGQWLPLI
jgi:hypothetical protein